jgi:hypothetical protein
MAKTKRDEELFQRLRAHGLRKRTAKLISSATDQRRKPVKAVERTLSELKKVVGEAEDRISGGPAKRSATAKKAANTRKRNAQARSNAAKKGARTRARSH